MKVGIIMGGISSEREVSIETGKGMLNNINKEKYDIVPVLLDNKADIIEKAKLIDFALLALHGRFGEDGRIQGALEALNIPYSGCGVLTSSLCMNKYLTKKIIETAGYKTPEGIIVSKAQDIAMEWVKAAGYPLVVKPNCGGSSIGTFIAEDQQQLFFMVSEALKFDEKVLVERYLKGEEYTVCMLNGAVLPIIAIKPANNFFDYISKYQDNGAVEEVAVLNQELREEIQELSLKLWDIFECRVYARIDLIVSDNVPYILEINTLPGMTKNSLFPKSARAAGIEYNELLELIIKYSLIERGPMN